MALASKGGGWNPLQAVLKAYLKVDHDIDYGGRTMHERKIRPQTAARQQILKAKLRVTVCNFLVRYLAKKSNKLLVFGRSTDSMRSKKRKGTERELQLSARPHMAG